MEGRKPKSKVLKVFYFALQLVLKGGVLTYIFNHFSVGQLGQNYKRLQTLETVKIVSVTDFEGDNNTYLSLENIILNVVESPLSPFLSFKLTFPYCAAA